MKRFPYAGFIISGLLSVLRVYGQGGISNGSDFKIEMTFVRGGSFEMGSSTGEINEKPVHTVSLSDFYIGKFEVTQKQWRDIMGKNPSSFSACEECPVETVSWNAIREFILQLNLKTGKSYRLPTEAEWEYAARGGSVSKSFVFSGSNTPDDVAWHTENSGSKSHPVGMKQPNELGIFDMSGNVMEWCSDWYGNYSASAQTNPKGDSLGQLRVIRGGGWRSFFQSCLISHRGRNSPGYRGFNLGFRLVLVN